MTIEITREDFEAADVVVILNLTAEGLAYEWSANGHDAEEVVALLRKAAGGIAAEAGVRSCRVCGCTDLSACTPPCSWNAPGLCSSHGDQP